MSWLPINGNSSRCNCQRLLAWARAAFRLCAAISAITRRRGAIGVPARGRLRGPPSVSLLPHIGGIKRMPTKNGPGDRPRRAIPWSQVRFALDSPLEGDGFRTSSTRAPCDGTGTRRVRFGALRPGIMPGPWKSDLVGSGIDPLYGVFGERDGNPDYRLPWSRVVACSRRFSARWRHRAATRV
jgi:hypothetical protein